MLVAWIMRRQSRGRSATVRVIVGMICGLLAPIAANAQAVEPFSSEDRNAVLRNAWSSQRSQPSEVAVQVRSTEGALFTDYGRAWEPVDTNLPGSAEPISSPTDFEEYGRDLRLQGSTGNPARLVQIDVGGLEALKGEVDQGRRSSVVLNLEPGHEWPAIFERSAPTERGYSLSGHLADDALSSVTFIVNGSIVSGMVSSVHGTWTIRNRGGATYEVVRTRGEGRCSVQSAVGSRPTNGEAGQQRAAAAEEDDGDEIDVLVLFTPAARQWAGGLDEMRALVDLWMAATNEAYLAGAAVQRIVLAGAVEVDYVESDEPEGNTIDLGRLWARDDGFMDEIHDLRDGYAADIVHLIVDHPRWVTGGAGYFPPRIVDDDGAVSLDWDGRFGFSVSEVEDVPSTFAHELGHNMGLNHDRYVQLQGGVVWNLPFPHSYGYVNQRAFEDEVPDTSRWHTIMAYQFQCFHQGDFNCVRLMRFSNPSQVYPEGGGDAMGVAGDEPSEAVAGPSDAVRTLDATRSIVGNYRQRADACRVTLSETSRTVDEGGASLSVEVQGKEGCSWRAWTPNGDFISVDETVGSGGESVTIRVEPNDGFARIGYVYVAAEGFVVRQRGIHAVADVCERTPAVATALVNQSGREDCATVTEFDLLSIGELDLDIWDDDRFALIPGRERLNGLEAIDFEGLSQLRRLSLVGHGLNKFGNPIPGMGIASLREGVFDHLVELKRLNMHSSGLTTIEPGAFGATKKLTTLYLSSNGLGHVALGIFDGLTELIFLALSNNGLSTLPEGVFGDLGRLGAIHLGENDFTTVPRALRSGLDEVTLVGLGFNPLQHLPDNAFTGLPKLNHISLFGAELSSIGPNAFADVSNLSRLDLRYNRLTELSTRIPGANILAIWLTGNRVATLGDGVFAGFTSEYCNGSTISLRLDLRENPGAPFELAVELDRVDGGDAAASPAQIVARVREGAPWPLTVSVAAGNDGLDTQNVRIGNGEVQSEPFEAAGGGPVTLRISSVDELPASYKGIKAVAGEPLVLFSMKDEALTVGGRPLAVDLDAALAKDGVAWEYVAVSSDGGVATVRVDGATLFVDPQAEGTTTVTVTATGEDGSQTVRAFEVRVSSPTLAEVGYMPSATEMSRQGFVRVINHYGQSGEVRVDAFDSTGTEFGPLTLSIRRQRNAPFQLGRPREWQCCEGTIRRHRPRAGRLAAGTGQRSGHRGALLHPDDRWLPDVDARRRTGTGWRPPGAVLQSGCQPQPGEPPAADQSRRRRRRGHNSRCR